LPGLDGDIGLGEFTENAVGKGVERVGSGSDVGDLELAIIRAVVPELVVIAVVLPGDRVAVARPGDKSARRAGVIRMSQTDGEIGQFGGGGLRVVKDELAGDVGTLGFVRVVHSVDPVKRPRGLDLFGLGQGIVPEGKGVVMPRCRDGGIALRGRECGQFGRGGVLWAPGR
jgi:hypothetical protein